MITLFEGCLNHVLKSEGGYVDNPLDHGGPTNFGITIETLSAYRGVACSAEDVKALTKNEAAKIYELKYWNTMRLDRVRAQKVALILFDLGVNMGPSIAIRMLQETLNESFKEKLTVDGVLGNRTDVAISTAPETALCRKLIQKAQARYAAICVSNPSQLVFLRGWLNRTFALWDAIA